MHHCCPHHADALVRNRIDAIDTWRCERCEGVWLPSAIVSRVVGEAPRWPQRADTSATDLRCPDDGTQLRAVDADGIELDLCPHCHGLWLDRDELAHIVRRKQQVQPGELVEEVVDEVMENVYEMADEAARASYRAGTRHVRNMTSSGSDAKADAASTGSPGGNPPAAGLPTINPAAMHPMHVNSMQAGSLHGNTTPASAGLPQNATDVFDVELDPCRVQTTPQSTSGGAGDVDLLDTMGELASDAVGAVFEFIGDVFSSI